LRCGLKELRIRWGGGVTSPMAMGNFDGEWTARTVKYRDTPYELCKNG